MAIFIKNNWNTSPFIQKQLRKYHNGIWEKESVDLTHSIEHYKSKRSPLPSTTPFYSGGKYHGTKKFNNRKL